MLMPGTGLIDFIMIKDHYQHFNYQLYCQINTQECVLTHIHLFYIYFYQSNAKYITKFLRENLVGKSCGKILVGKSCGKILQEILVGKSFGKILWEILQENLAGNCCGKILWEILQEILWEILWEMLWEILLYLSPNHFWRSIFKICNSSRATSFSLVNVKNSFLKPILNWFSHMTQQIEA